MSSAAPLPPASKVFGIWGRPATVVALALAWLALAVFFYNWPELDIALSGQFFIAKACDADTAGKVCGSFALAYDPFWQVLRDFNRTLPVALTVLVALYAAWRWYQERSLADPRIRFKFTLMWTMIVGPLLFTNALLKQNWGRPRPVHTDLFGGNLPFVPAGIKTDYCPANCSFISGEASSAFWLVCLAFIVPRPWRKAAIAVALALAVFASGLRIAFGGHYLSDVVLGALATLMVFALMSLLDMWIFAREELRRPMMDESASRLIE